jgi:UDP-N-acetylglucosamine 2-epimerase (non-hydrolysing)
MIDSLAQFKDRAAQSNIRQEIGIDDHDYCLVTLHRPRNVDNYQGLKTILAAFKEISRQIKLVFPIHPRTLKQLESLRLKKEADSMDNLILIEPAGYYDFIKLQMDARFIITDSGGVQEESTWFGIPCLTLRPNTERPITVTEGTNQLVPLDTEMIIASAQELLAGRIKKGKIPEYWDGKTAERIVKLFKEKI